MGTLLQQTDDERDMLIRAPYFQIYLPYMALSLPPGTIDDAATTGRQHILSRYAQCRPRYGRYFAAMPDTITRYSFSFAGRYYA